MAQLKLITTGMVGESELLLELRLRRTIYLFSELFTQSVPDSRIYQGYDAPILSILSDPSWLLHLDMPFDVEELRTPITESSEHHSARAILAAFLLSHARTLVKSSSQDGVILGREYGLTLVPMQPQFREEIRRMADLTALSTGFVDTYDIYFAGGFYLNLKSSPSIQSSSLDPLIVSQTDPSVPI